ncbi:RNB-domain-containing protein [Ceraceosorus guamensis]|uniref:DIS3-like exonuclease 2 n=1 Tax=Ceraceosorus guamensis TaxID=1522189 RepID=A0A316VRA9_9BASI|nr:RNB-domain-containing protein [Ceraceosorus guamensis]PWN40199.1 RNB-domain-containing protein [Ceraceosorus guamensis]
MGARLAQQEEQLQAQLAAQLGRSNESKPFSRGGPLPSLGEDVEAPSPPSLPFNPSHHRQGGPRFAGNVAFQSALARHGGDQTSNAHSRQLSLQARFAEMGMGSGNYDAEDATDDGSSIADYMGGGAFDPTRHHDNGHRRTGSEMPLSTAARSGHLQSASFGGGSPTGAPGGGLLAEQLALQQQIEMLQLQQQALLQQQVHFNPSSALGGQPTSPMGPASGARGGQHRRIQSHAPQTGPMGSFSTGNTFGLSGGFNPQPHQQLQQQGGGNVPRGHGRRHSVNIVNKNAQAAQSQQQQLGGSVDVPAPTMNATMDFSFPPQQQAQQSMPQPSPYQPSTRTGHFSHPSVQLASTLSPEYLMAGGGLLNLGSLGGGNNMTDLADGFAGQGGGASGRGGHGRTGSASWRINGPAPGAGQVMDLSAAQAQLASLHQFRAQSGATGGGAHNRNTSFGGGFNPAMLPGFAGGQFGYVPGMPPQPQGGNAASQRKALFGSYLPQASLPPLLAAGKLVVGILRVNKRNRSDAWVTTEVLDSDIFISGSKDRNRALEGDLVAVELLDPNEVWSIKKDKEDKKKRKEEQGNVVARKPDKAKDDLEVEGAQLKLIDDEEENDQSPPALAGHVVAIVERTPGQLFSGTLGLLRPSSAATKEKQQAERALREGGDGTQGQEPQARPKIVWFRPTDKRVPLIAIPADQAPADFWEEGGQESYNNRLFVACIKRWPITSLHPFGTLVEELGVIGNTEAETQALLKDCLSSATEDFGENALKCLPPLPWSIPEREHDVRRDFRSTRVFTIDPATAKDLDDALSITRLEGGLFEVGVHIADVSHFVKIGSALDRDARKRATSVYLVQRAIPMLPPTLSEELCSLVPNVERLTFSAVFTMNKDARVIGSWFGRTIIKSCAKLAYGDAQQVIEGVDANEAIPLEKVDANSSHSQTDIAGDILLLHEFAQKMRARRFEGGALRIDNTRLSFRLDDLGQPTDAIPHKLADANRVVEEFMLLANTSVAQQIAAGLPDVALLRRHERPILRRLEGFKARAAQMGFDVDISSAGALYKSLSSIKDVGQRAALETLATKSMQKAKYFSTGMVDIAKYAHFALNVPVYTHFTSPIRRYADVMVHRQLEAVLQGTDKFPVDREGMAKIAQQCNVKRDAAKLAQEQSAHLFLCLLIHDLTVRYGPVVRQATVIGVLDAAFDVVVPEFGLEKRVHTDAIPLEHYQYDEHTNSLSLYWKQDIDVLSYLAETGDDVHVQGLRRLELARAMEMTSQSHTDEAALFDDEDDEVLAEAKRKVFSGEDAKGSTQRMRSFQKQELTFDNTTVTNGHHIMTVKSLATLPVIITADITRSPPVLKVFSVNPWAQSSARTPAA